jgi:aminoglycoside N3'-acetyltransferase
MGPGAPVGLLHADGGSCLLLGVDYKSNTFHHAVEMALGVPCLGQRTESLPMVLSDGRRVEGRTWSWRNAACPFTDEDRYGGRMAARRLQCETTIGNCRAVSFSLEDCFQVVAQMLQVGTDGFPPCSGCTIHPLRGKDTAPSDWDAMGNVQRADSVAWSY